MPDVAGWIKAYGVPKFMRLSGRDQNKLLYATWPQAKTSNLRTQKNNFLNTIIDDKIGNETKVINSSIKKTSSHASPPPAGSPPPSQAGGVFEPPDVSNLPGDQQSLFKIAWDEYLNNPTPQWFSTLTSFMEKTNQLKTEADEESQQISQLTNDELISLIKPDESLPSVIDTPASLIEPHSTSINEPSN